MGVYKLYGSEIKHLLRLVNLRQAEPGRTRQEVIQLKSPILLKLSINVGFGE